MNNNEDSQNQQNQQVKDSSKLTIEVRRFQNLLEILKDRKKVLNLAVAIAITGSLLFCGITLIVLSIKRLYPYNDITTNAMGTTTLRSENKDVSYFLLSSSELWANSGIRVKKGETITIKSSGKKHSAIHHLVAHAKENHPELRDPWVGSEGFPEDFDKRNERDKERARYRIFPKTNQDILLLQIVPDDGTPIDRPNGLIFDSNKNEFNRSENRNKFIVVGNRMNNIHIDMDGILYFAINDIVLDEETITKMMLECSEINSNNLPDTTIIRLVNRTVPLRQKYNSFRTEYDSLYTKNDVATDENKKRIENSLNKVFEDYLKELGIKEEAYSNYQNKKSYGKFEFGKGYGLDSTKIELYGYFMNNYRNAWYEDNVGSFLIVVEKVND